MSVRWTCVSLTALALFQGAACGDTDSDSDPGAGPPDEASMAPAAGETVKPTTMPGMPGPLPAQGSTQPGTPAPAANRSRPAPLTSDQAQQYARRLLPMLAGRTLNAAEVTRLQKEGETALGPLIETWVAEPRFAEAARTMIALNLRASGKQGTTDLDLPGNLAAYLVKNKRPWADIIGADHCVDAKGMQVPCDTGAPYAAGVLATRAFLMGNVGRFNLRRARTVMQTFACLDYPMSIDVQPRLPRDLLLPMFQADMASEQTVEAARGTFGNGHACYTCHSQFGAHAQLFVKFDESGKWKDTATGIQDPKGEPGRSLGGFYASHMNKADEAASEATQVFGKRVANLNEAARVIAGSPRFLPCQAKTLIGYAFSLPESDAHEMPDEIIDQIVSAAKAREPAPTLAALAVAAFTHPSIIRSVRLGPTPSAP